MASRSKKVKFSYHDGFILESEGRASDDERLTAKGLESYPSVLDFWKIKFEKSSSTNWIFGSISKLIPAGSKNPVWNRLKIQFVKLDFSNLIFQKSSTDKQGLSYVTDVHAEGRQAGNHDKNTQIPIITLPS